MRQDKGKAQKPGPLNSDGARQFLNLLLVEFNMLLVKLPNLVAP